METGVLILVLCICTFLILTSAIPINTRQTNKKPITFEDIFTGRFYFASFNGSWISDEEILFRRYGDLIKYDMSNGNSQVFLEADVYNNWVSPSFTYSTDYTKLLVRFNVTYVFRHSIVAQYDVYDIASKTITRVGNGEPLNFCVLSPNGNLVAFVKDNNVFTQTINGDEIQLTNDGINGVVYNGVPDWVYEEEVLGSGGALWFSPSGNKIAIASFDDTDVEEFTYVMYENQYEKEERLRYPKAGRMNPTVQFRYIDLSDPSMTWHTFAAPVEKVTDDHILYSVNWITDDVVGAFWLNRRQNLGSYQICSTIGSRNCYEVSCGKNGLEFVLQMTSRCQLLVTRGQRDSFFALIKASKTKRYRKSAMAFHPTFDMLKDRRDHDHHGQLQKALYFT